MAAPIAAGSRIVADTDDIAKKQDDSPTPAQQPAVKKDLIRDNGPRIVGAMKFMPDFLQLTSGLADKAYFRCIAACGFMVSRSILLINGTKDRKIDAANPADMPDKNDQSLGGRIRYNLYKITHPNQFPVESGAGVATLSGSFIALSGATQMTKKGHFWEGLIELLSVGIITTACEANVLLGAEKPKAQPKTATDKSARSGDLLQTLKDQPVLLSGVVQTIVSVSQIALGLLIFNRKNKQAATTPAEARQKWYYIGAGTLYTLADIIYASMVRKNEFHQSDTPAKPADGKTTPFDGQSAPATAAASAPGSVISQTEPQGKTGQTLQLQLTS